MRRILPFILLAAVGSACSPLNGVYTQPGYLPRGPNPVKRIAITAWAPAENKGLADTLTAVATDLVKLRKNYLVYETQPQTRSFSDLCKEKIEGVLVARTLAVHQEGRDVTLNVALELYRCTDGALLWVADGDDTIASDDDNLVKLTGNYSTSVGEAAKVFAAPAFSLLQQLVAELPDPVLSDEDINEKIELG